MITLVDIEARELLIASRRAGGIRRVDRVWLRSEAIKQLRAEQLGGGR